MAGLLICYLHGCQYIQYWLKTSQSHNVLECIREYSDGGITNASNRGIKQFVGSKCFGDLIVKQKGMTIEISWKVIRI